MIVPLNSQPAHYITLGDKRLPLIATKHPRARNMIVRYDAKRNCVRLTMPRHTSLKTALAFAESRREWLAKQLHKVEKIAFSHGTILPLFGHKIILQHAAGRGIAEWKEDRLIIRGDVEFLPRRVRDAIMQRMKLILEERTIYYANLLGVSVKSISLRDMHSRWGSCSSSGALSFCWRLAFAPYEVMDYVICHEVTHIKHLHHGQRFWAEVARLFPEYEKQEAWLKHYGQSVWNYG